MTAPLKHFGRTQHQWEKLCLSKRRYTDEYVARAAIQTMLLETSVERRPRQIWPYKCPNCRGWHMTSRGYLNRSTQPVTPTALYADDVRNRHLHNTYTKPGEPHGRQEEDRQEEGLRALPRPEAASR